MRLSAHDNALIKSKVAKQQIVLVLAVCTPYTDEEGACVVRVSHVDHHAVAVITENGNKHWVNKAFIVSTGEPDD